MVSVLLGKGEDFAFKGVRTPEKKKAFSPRMAGPIQPDGKERDVLVISRGGKVSIGKADEGVCFDKSTRGENLTS